MSSRLLLWALVGVVLLSVGAVWGQGNEPPGYLVIDTQVRREEYPGGVRRVSSVSLVPAKGGEARELLRYTAPVQGCGARLSPGGDFILYSTPDGPKAFNTGLVMNDHRPITDVCGISPRSLSG